MAGAPWLKYQAPEANPAASTAPSDASPSQESPPASSGAPWLKYQALAAPAAGGVDLKSKPDAPAPITPAEASLYGGRQGLTFGFGDEISSGVAAGKAKIFDHDPRDFSKIYDDKVAADRAYLARVEKEQPGYYYGGMALGGVPWSFVPGVGLASEAGLGAKFMGLLGMGMAQGAGDSTANPFTQTDQLLGDSIKGGAVASGVGAALGGASGALSRFAPDALRRLAESRAVKAVTGQSIAALRKITGTTANAPGGIEAVNAKIGKVGRDLLDSGAIKPFDTVESLAPKVSQLADFYGQQIGNAGSQVDQALPNAVNGKAIADKIVDFAGSIPQTESGKTLSNRLLDEASNFESKPAMSFAEAQDFKNAFKFKPQDADALVSSQDATNKIKSIIGSEMDAAAAKAAETAPEKAPLAAQYKDIKSKYGSFDNARNASTYRAMKDLTNRYSSPSDYGVGATASLMGQLGQAAMGHGGPISYALSFGLGAGAAAANKFARTRGNSTAAVMADGLANLLDTKIGRMGRNYADALQNAALRGPESLVVTHNLLMTLPDYKQNFVDLKGQENPTMSSDASPQTSMTQHQGAQ